MTMDRMVLERLIDEVKAPIAALQAQIHQQASELLRRHAELERLRKVERDFRIADLPFNNLYRAAERVAKLNGVARQKAITELKEAMKAAEPFIDQIPF